MKQRERLHEERRSELQPTAAWEILSTCARLGSTHLDALTARTVEVARTGWAREYQRATVISWLRVLRTVLNGAVAHGMIATNLLQCKFAQRQPLKSAPQYARSGRTVA